MRLAVIGSGVSGLVSAYLLGRHHEVTVLEAAPRIGGHVHTREIADPAGPVAIDSGFIVYNERTYPNFIRLLDELGVATQVSDMSFSVMDPARRLEYNGHDLNTLFAQRRNLLRPRFFGMIRDILRFNRSAPLALEADGDLSLGEYLERGGYGEWFRESYLIPMGAAIWSASTADMLRMPLRFFVRFFDHHGMLSVDDRPQWRVISGGSMRYVESLLTRLDRPVQTGCPVSAIRRHGEGVRISVPGDELDFDGVVIAAHGDQALRLLADPSEEEREILGAFAYARNPTVLHTDTVQMPRHRRAWASWNYHRVDAAEHAATVTYFMNRLQNLDAQRHYLVSLNREGTIDPDRILERMEYEHPVYNAAAVTAQQRYSEISGQRRTWYAGAYWANGFHEDGVVSAKRVADQLGVSW